MAAFHPSELDDNKYNTYGNGAPELDDDDEKKMSSDVNLAFNEMDVIRDEISKTQPLVSEKKPLSNLLEEFKEQENFRRQMQTLIDSKTHSEYRPMRQDGNCFYRAFLLAFFEYVEQSGDLQLLAKVSELSMTSLYQLEKLQYESFTIEDFYETFMDELKWLQNKINSGNTEYKSEDGQGHTTTERLSNEFHSQSLIFWARMLTSLYIQENKNDFIGFIQGKSLHEFIKADVEALHAEADQPQFSALSAALNVPFRVFTIENIDKGGPNIVHSMGDHRKPIFDLLFRPGHYDIIYRSQSYDAILDAQREITMSAADTKNTNNSINNNNNSKETKTNDNSNSNNQNEKQTEMKSNKSTNSNDIEMNSNANANANANANGNITSNSNNNGNDSKGGK